MTIGPAETGGIRHPAAGGLRLDGLRPHQRRAIPHLVAAVTRDAGSRAAGISRSTLTAWLTDPKFRAALRRAEDSAFGEVLDHVRKCVTRSVAILAGLASSRRVPPAVRAGAASKLLDVGLKVHETIHFHDRLSAIEERLSGGPGDGPKNRNAS